MAVSARPNRGPLFQRIATALRGRGWRAVPSHLGVLFRKRVEVREGEINLALVFLGGDLTAPPKALIEPADPDTKIDFPWHRIGSYFCYIDEESVEWDSNKAGFLGNIVWAADYAERRLAELAGADSVSDADQEFDVYWMGRIVYSDLKLDPDEPLEGVSLTLVDLKRGCGTGQDSNIRVLVNQETQLTERFSEFDLDRREQLPTVSIHATSPLRAVRGLNAPKSLHELNQWVDEQPGYSRKQLSRQIARARSKCPKATHILVVIHGPGALFGALMDIGKANIDNFGSGGRLSERLRGKQLPAMIPVQRLELLDLSEDFLWSRNAPETKPPLAGLRVHLVGAGSVGSLLAKELVSLGCGAGQGALHIFDIDRLRPENLSRHLLGVDYLNQPKATGVVHFLKRSMLAGNLISWEKSGADPTLHADADLVIDATGIPHISNRLNAATANGDLSAVMFVTVLGKGWSTMTHLYTGDKKSACRNCIQPWAGGRYSPIPEELEDNVERPSCGGSYTPFYGFASSAASAQAAELVMDWACNRAGKSLRVHVLDHAPRGVKRVRSCSPKPLPDCYCQATPKKV